MLRVGRFWLAALSTIGAAALVLLFSELVGAQEDPDPGHGVGTVPTDGLGIIEGEPAPSREVVERGRALFQTGCSSCHGADGQGVTGLDGRLRGPAVDDSGSAAAYYYLTTGRMPMTNPRAQPVRKPPAYDDEEITALVAFVDSLGVGPDIPAIDIDGIEGAELAEGGVVFRSNCAPCHSAAGVGGALSYGRAAPSLGDSEPLQVATAARSGPGQMPVFGRELSPDDLNRVAAYVDYLRSPEDPGGVPIGRVGPIPEGFVAWVFGIGGLLLAVGWIGTRIIDAYRARRAAS
ncbi:MAG: cytochrome bc1 complex diheme cytochrome c subunit [Acidimicrobiales bacterium]